MLAVIRGPVGAFPGTSRQVRRRVIVVPIAVCRLVKTEDGRVRNFIIYI